MAIYSMNVKVISRGKGQSAIASASYRSGEKLESERYGTLHYYPRKVAPEAFILKPDHAPDWTLDRERLWNEVEAKESRKDSRLARSFTIALPREMTHEQQRELAEDYVKNAFVKEGMVADCAIHRDDENNPHLHVMTTLRAFKKDGEWAPKTKTVYITDDDGNKLKTPAGNVRNRKEDYTDWNSKERTLTWRKEWARIANQHLEMNGYTDRISEKSYAERGIDDVPTIHEGYVAREIENRGEVSERISYNQAIKQVNYRQNTKNENEKIKNISNSLSPSEKKVLSELSKELKTYINYETLEDKAQMLQRWEQSINVKKDLNIDTTEQENKYRLLRENVEKADEILDNRAKRIMQKYYPKVPENAVSRYARNRIVEETLAQDRVLSQKEFKEVIEHAKEDSIERDLKIIYPKVYSKNISYYYNIASKYKEEKRSLLYTHGLSENELKATNNLDLKEKYSKLASNERRAKQAILSLDKYYRESIKEKYPTLDTDNLKPREREALSKAISYYGEMFSLNTLLEAQNKGVFNKYSYADREIALDYLDKLENNEMTDKDWNELDVNYHKRKIFETISDESSRKMFQNEIEHKGNVNHSVLGQLLSSTNVIQNLQQATFDNMNRNQEDDRSKRKKKGQKKAQTHSL